jgi:peroxiredoxin
MLNTFELGPFLNVPAPAFMVRDHESRKHILDDLMGKNGLLLGFIGDIWLPASVRRILWLQRHASTFMRMEINLALLICDKPHTLYGFQVSSPVPLEFPLLSDVDREVHERFNMTQISGLVMLDGQQVVRHKWLVPDERVWPHINELLQAAQSLND